MSKIEEYVNRRLEVKKQTSEHGVGFVRWERYSLTTATILRDYLQGNGTIDRDYVSKQLGNTLNYLTNDFLINNYVSIITLSMGNAYNKTEKPAEESFDVAIANLNDMITEIGNINGIRAFVFTELLIATYNLGFTFEELLDKANELTDTMIGKV